MPSREIRLAIIWVDWYAYHVARLQGLLSVPELAGRVAGIELVGGIGVHEGLKFREPIAGHLPVHTLLPNSSWREAGQLRLARLVWKKLSSLNPAAVMVPGYATLPALSAALWARLHRRPGILMTETTAYDHERVPWKEMVKSILVRALFDFAVAGGKAHIRYLEQLAFPPTKIARYYDVVNNEFLCARTTELRRSNSRGVTLPNSPYFLYVGRLAPEKNVRGLLTSWLQYRAEGGIWPLVLVGDGPSAEDLRQQSEQSKFGTDVHFAGLRSSDQLPLFYAFAGCFVLSSTREPWGLVVNEAMASGLPVLVSSRCGAAEDLVEDGRNGFIFDPNSPQQLARHMQYISSLNCDDRQLMGDESLQIIATYSPLNFGREVASLLRMAGACE
jgi:glycosyltransferase involved in cell wall biosynthesis